MDGAILKRHFMAWQCRLRQMAVRQFDGRPLEGLRPRVVRLDASEIVPTITTLIVEHDPAPSIDLFRHIYRKTHDPRARHREALSVLSSVHYQYPENFDDRLTASFARDSGTAAALLAIKTCVLEFAQFGQAYRIPCRVSELAEDEPAYRASYWHNKLFNPAMPADIRILAFAPDWSSAEADPPPD